MLRIQVGDVGLRINYDSGFRRSGVYFKTEG